MLSRIAFGLTAALVASVVLAHGISGGDANYVQAINGPAMAPFAYLGAKHMMTGYDHLLYLVGVVFFVYQPGQVLRFVTLFAVGHSITLLSGVLFQLRIDPYLVDAVIGLSIVYKAFENLGGFKKVFSFEPNVSLAVFVFGLVHGFGLATKLQAFELSENGLVTNIISFNVGVEVGQLLALSFVLVVLTWWRRIVGFTNQAVMANTLLMGAGFLLAGYQLSGYLVTSS